MSGRSDGKAAEIIRMREARPGWTQDEIARALGCSQVWVSHVLNAHFGRSKRVSVMLRGNDFERLAALARRHGLRPSEMARAILVDGIAEAVIEEGKS